MAVWRVRDRRTFGALRSSRLRCRSGPLTVTAVLDHPTPDDQASQPPRVAFAITTKVGNAAVRNKLRRRLRAIVADLAPVSGAYLVSCGGAAPSSSYADLRSHVEHALQQLGAMR